MPGFSDTIAIYTNLILRMARHIRNTDEVALPTWAGQGMKFLEEVQNLFPEEYAEKVKKRGVVLREIPCEKQSTYTHTKKRQEKEYTEEGEYRNDKKPWTGKQIDNLLEKFLNYGYRMLAKDTKQCLVGLCERPSKAIQKALWRLGVRDITRSRFGTYKPLPSRPRRTVNRFNSRDLYLIMLAFSPTGIKNAANTPAWLGNILNRDPQNVANFLCDLFRDAVQNNLRWRGVRYNHLNPTHLQIMFTYLKKKQASNRKLFGDV